MIHGYAALVTCGPSTVASTAIAMPIMPYRFPRREVSGFESPPRLRMKRIAAPRYETVSSVVDTARLLAEHLQHALRNGEAAEHIDRDEGDAQHGQADDPAGGPAGRLNLEGSDLHERAEGDDAR